MILLYSSIFRVYILHLLVFGAIFSNFYLSKFCIFKFLFVEVWSGSFNVSYCHVDDFVWGGTENFANQVIRNF